MIIHRRANTPGAHKISIGPKNVSKSGLQRMRFQKSGRLPLSIWMSTARIFWISVEAADNATLVS